jgi:hypothetical protein
MSISNPLTARHNDSDNIIRGIFCILCTSCDRVLEKLLVLFIGKSVLGYSLIQQFL